MLNTGEGGSSPQAVLTVNAYRQALGAYYQSLVDQFISSVRAAPESRRALKMAAGRFISSLCDEIGRQQNAHTLLIDQGVRPWLLSRIQFYDTATVVIVRRDVRDQIIDRIRHGLDSEGFVPEMRRRLRKTAQSIKLFPGYSFQRVWFEAIITDRGARHDLIRSCGMLDARLVGARFNPVASRQSIGLYDKRPDLLPDLNDAAPLYFSSVSPERLLRTEAADQKTYSHALPRNGSFRKTVDLDLIPSPIDLAKLSQA